MPVDAFAHLDLAALLHDLVERVTKWHSVVWCGDIARIEARWNELRIPGVPKCVAVPDDSTRAVRPPPSQ